MKKMLLILLLLFVLITSTTACFENTADNSDSNSENSESETSDQLIETADNTSQHYTLEDYFPFSANTHMIYAGTGNEYASYDSYVDYMTDDRIQLRTNDGGTETVTVYERKDGKVTMLLSKSECYYRDDLIASSSTDEEILIQEPLQEGNSWTLSDGSKRQISGINISVHTPWETYETLEITTTFSASTKLDYYAPGIGLVKSIYYSNENPDDQIISELEEIQQNTPLTQSIRFYYPNSNVDAIYYTTKEVDFYTNDLTNLVITSEYKELPSNKTATVLTENAEIQTLYFNQTAEKPYIDFSSSFLTDMNAGSGYESLILQSITNTIGNYYSTNEVSLTVNSELYSSGHIAMEPGEYFIVDESECSSLDSE